MPAEEAREFPAFQKKEAQLFAEGFQHEETEMLAQAREEYSPGQNVFANFNRIAKRLGLQPEEVLATYLLKHMDGIISWVAGNQNQRDSIHGRIMDARNYLLILELMVLAQEKGMTSTDPEGSYTAQTSPQEDETS